MIKVDLRPKPFTFGKLLGAIQRIVSPVLLIGASVFALGLYFLSPFAKGDPTPYFVWPIVLGYVLGVIVRRLGRQDNNTKDPIFAISLLGVCFLGVIVLIHIIRASPIANWLSGACYLGIASLTCVVGDPFLSRRQSRTAKPTRRINWRSVAGVASIVVLAICVFFEDRDPRSIGQCLIAFLGGAICGLAVATARASAKRARESYQGDLHDHIHDTLWPVNRMWSILTLTIAVPAGLIWIFPIFPVLKWWPHGAFYYTGLAIGGFVIASIIARILRRDAENAEDEIITD